MKEIFAASVLAGLAVNQLAAQSPTPSPSPAPSVSPAASATASPSPKTKWKPESQALKYYPRRVTPMTSPTASPPATASPEAKQSKTDQKPAGSASPTRP